MHRTIKTRTGREIILPPPEENAAINTGIAADPDTHELTEAEFAQLKPMRGRPQVEVKRPMLSMRVDPDILEALRATGRGWQTRVNALLREVVERKRL